jgi:hypothetical protein
MNYSRRESLGVFVLALSLFTWTSVSGQVPPSTGDRFLTKASNGVASNESSGTSDTSGTSDASGTPDNGWHVDVSPYLWFPGLSGTIGLLGRNASVQASPGDILSHLGIGLMGAMEVRKNRFVLPVDFMWVKLEGDHSTPINPGVSYINVNVKQTILTPGAGYRIVDRAKLKVDARVGLRYWHLGQNLSFQPSGIFSNSSQSANWVDVVAGGKFEAVLTPKLMVTVLGDAGGGGANLDYEVVILLGLKVSQRVLLQAGWRYLDVDYRTSAPALFVYDIHQSGAIAGVTIRLK